MPLSLAVAPARVATMSLKPMTLSVGWQLARRAMPILAITEATHEGCDRPGSSGRRLHHATATTTTVVASAALWRISWRRRRTAGRLGAGARRQCNYCGDDHSEQGCTRSHASSSPRCVHKPASILGEGWPAGWTAIPHPIAVSCALRGLG